MWDDAEAAHRQAAIQRLMRRLNGFARGLGLDEVVTREIVMRIAADMPERSDEDRLESARRCLLAAASA